MSISPSAYFTYGETSNHENNLSTSVYLTLSLPPKYLFLAYDNYHEKNFYQNLFALGYTQPVISRIWLRMVGFGYLTSTNNVGISLASRFFYGFNPIFSLGYIYSIYSKFQNNNRRFFNINHLNPDFQYTIAQMIFTTGIIYTNANNESYYAGSGKISVDLTKSLKFELSGLYGKTFYHIDDRLLIVNNRYNIQTGRIAFKSKYQLPIKNIIVSGVITSNVYKTYHINYFTIGFEYNKL